MASKYVDIPSIMQVIGCIYQNNSLLDNEKYFFTEEDFTEEFHKILFGSMYNLHQSGIKEITVRDIEDYLSNRPSKLSIYKVNHGDEYLYKLLDIASFASFDYYYNRMKKMTLLRMYNNVVGMDLSWLYDINNVLDLKKKQAQEDWLDNTNLVDIADVIDKKLASVRAKYVDNSDTTVHHAGDNGMALLESLIETPEIGYPLYGDIFNTITRGARLKKFYLRSAATGVGKTRMMIADACSIACNELYINGQWQRNGTQEPTIFITTEQQLDEIQTMMWAFIADVNEDHIIYNQYEPGELARVKKAIQILDSTPLYIKELPNFSIQDIENSIKYGIQEYGTRYIFFDYIHTSLKILEEVSSKTGVKGLREDNILFMLSIKLKDMCNQYGVFIMSATQLNSDYVTADQYDQNLLRGAKAIADKIDMGQIALEVNKKDEESLSKIIAAGGFEKPDIKISVYKNRRGRYKNILVWCKADRGTCKIKPLFVTDYKYELVQMKELKIVVKE